MTTTVADYLITRLQQAGLEHLFAVPGDYASPFLQAVDASDGITRIPTINELGAGYAADGYARLKGIGAVCVQYGVGTFSLLNCTAGSFVERVPVVVISASPSTKDRQLERSEAILFHHSTGDLRADQRVFQQVTVASIIVRSAEDAPAQIDGAITALLTHRRPIYIEVLNDVWTQLCALPVGTLAPVVRPSDPDALKAALDAAWERIQGAQRPVLWLGVEIQRYGLQDTVQQLVDARGIPFTTTSLGKTVLDERQQSFMGTYAGPAYLNIAQMGMSNADCIIALGTIITDDYLNIMHSSFGKMIEVTDEETRVGYGYYHGVMLKDFVEGLLARFQNHHGYPRTYGLPEAQQEAPPTAGAPPEPEPDASASSPLIHRLSYNIFFEQLRVFLQTQPAPDQIALILGESTSLYVFGGMDRLPRNCFVAQAAWGSLGHETGCALGVALASGKLPFVVAGDGGFRMICQELSSLAYQKCNAVVFVMSNQVYAIEQAFVDISAFTPEGQFAPFDVLPAWDYVALAHAFGAKGYRVTSVEELWPVLDELKSINDVPALVEVVIPQKDLPPELKRLAETPPETAKYRP